ncbi:conjugal transfer protein TraG [Bradyrhizobium hipponense]|uniref:Conjugal transfer protein TraG n=1 Tax=Bradyrhizobium hipponense TaxID=2605638 RepID=A0A5S4YG30_9BRAD|nr:conjugal transfer protein TraG [Bradyrhizobium hipponense]TYO63356.1 conjugal transfer protein TraG [Bradyrhizobium hipponense]
MSATKIIWHQVILVCLIAFTFVWAATEWTAYQLAFQPQLGPAWFRLGNWPIYEPFAFFIWWFEFDAYAPTIFLQGGAIAGSGGIAAVAAAMVLSVLRAHEARDVTTYGSARWADTREVKRAGLLDADGLVLGRFDGRYLRHDGPEHVLCFAPTRSGKGVGLVVPTLLTWPRSVIVHDIKGENFQLTSGWRARLGDVLLFDPTNAASAAYNPLLEIRRGDCEVRDAQNVADILVDPEGALERRNHWEKTSHSLLVGAILHVLYAEADKTLAGVARFLSDPCRPIETTLNAMLATPHLGDRVHPVVASAARELLNKSENERSGVLSTTMSFLGLYRDPVVAKVTARSDWRIRDLVDRPQPVSLYLVVPPSDIVRTKPLMRLILNQIGRRLTESLDPDRRRQKLLLMLDEFAALGRLDFFESQLAFMAGYGIRSFLITQSLNQLERAYGPNHAILDNCHIRIAFSTNDERTAKRVSDALGTATELRAMKNYAGHRLSPWLGHLMVSRQETSRPLLTPGEIMQLSSKESIVMVSGLHPLRATKVRYYEDPQFQKRIFKPAETGTILLSTRPDEDWSGHPSAAPSIEPLAPRQRKHGDPNGGLRREPELPQHEEIEIKAPLAEHEFDAGPDEPDADAVQAQALSRAMQGVARATSLDPDDGMDL